MLVLLFFEASEALLERLGADVGAGAGGAIVDGGDVNKINATGGPITGRERSRSK
jgi:hypothetical protein